MVRLRQIADPQEWNAQEIEILREHVEDRDEYGHLDEEAREALERVERMHTLLPVQGEGSPRALLASMGGVDGIESRLEPRLCRVDLILEPACHQGEGEEEQLHGSRQRDDGDAGVADDQGKAAEQMEEAEAHRAEPPPEPGEEESSELGILGSERGQLYRPRVDPEAPGEPLFRHRHRQAFSRMRLHRGGAVWAERDDPESIADPRPVRRAERAGLLLPVSYHAHAVRPGDHSLHVLQHSREAG